MREFKFRVWSKSSKNFLIPHQEGYEIQPWTSISFSGEIMYGDNQGSFVDSKQEDYIIQQFTGLKDKNGKDLYEGDLVKVWKEHEAYLLKSIFHEKDFSVDYTCGEIKWVCESFKVCQKYIGAIHLSEFSTCGCCPCALEKIGDVFSNPELLNENKNLSKL